MFGEIHVGYLVMIALGALGIALEIPGGAGLFAEGLKGAIVEGFSSVHLGERTAIGEDEVQEPHWVRARYMGTFADGRTQWCWENQRWTLPPQRGEQKLCAYRGELHWCIGS